MESYGICVPYKSTYHILVFRFNVIVVIIGTPINIIILLAYIKKPHKWLKVCPNYVRYDITPGRKCAYFYLMERKVMFPCTLYVDFEIYPSGIIYLKHQYTCALC